MFDNFNFEIAKIFKKAENLFFKVFKRLYWK